jgi:hypothetical protein
MLFATVKSKIFSGKTIELSSVPAEEILLVRYHLEKGIISLRQRDDGLDDLMPFFILFLQLFLFGLLTADLDFTNLIPVGPFDFGRWYFGEGLEDDSL